MTGYELSKAWFKWCKANRPLINPNHHALYFWIIEKANSLEWCPSFGLPSDDAMHHLGIGSYKTYIKAFDDLEKFGFIKVIERSKNQFTCNIIALVEFTEANDKASTKAIPKAQDKASPKQSEYNKTFKLLNLKTIKPINKEKGEFSENENLLLSENELIKSELEKRDLALKEANDKIKALEEKSKTPIKKDVKIFDELVYNFPQDFSEETKDLFMRFLTNRKRMKKEVKTQRALNGLIEKLKPFDDSIRIIAIDNSINANWMDLFPKPEQRATFDYSKNNNRNGYSNQSIPLRTPTPYVYDNSKD